MVPNAAFLDPELTATVPPQITADTGMDVLTHALEAYVSTRSGDFTDACAEKRSAWFGNIWNRQWRMEATWRPESTCTMLPAWRELHLSGASLGICHSLARCFGRGVSISLHGRSNAILLPHVIATMQA